jgi:hypothetical protein
LDESSSGISTKYYRGYGEFFRVLFINLAKSNNKILGLMTRAEFYGTIKLKKEMRREKKVFFNDLEIFA